MLLLNLTKMNKQQLLRIGVRILFFGFLFLVFAWAQRTIHISEWEVYSRLGLIYLAWITFTVEFKLPQ